MVARDDIIKFLETYLRVEDFEDGCHNGLQVEGAAEVTRIAMGVSANAALINAAVKRGAEMIICHHGMFYGRGILHIGGVMRSRLHALLTNNVSLVGLHLPLDYHHEVGNGVSLLRTLGCRKFEQKAGEWVGHLPTPLPREEFQKLVQQYISPNVCAVLTGPERISTVMTCTGAGARLVHKAVNEKVDAFITGEPKEDVIDYVREVGLNFIAAGHYNTEVFGAKALGEKLAKEFGVIVEFIDVPNPA